MARGDLQTPYNDAVMPTPDAGASGGGGLTSGYPLEGGREASPNSESGVPNPPQVYTLDQGGPSYGAQIPMPGEHTPGTLHDDMKTGE